MTKRIRPTMLRTTLHLTCPACGAGPIFRSGYALRRDCPACRLRLGGRDGAHFGGPLALGYGVGSVAGLGVFAVLFARFGLRTWIVWATVAAVVLSILATFRHCKAWWVWWLYRTGELGRPPGPRSG